MAAVPQPPLLVPELVGAAAAEVEPLRVACERAVERLGTGRWYAVGVDESGPVIVGPNVRGTFRGYGVDVPVSLTAGADAEPARLALPLLVAGWLRGLAGARSVVGELMHPSTDPASCLARGKELAAELEAGGVAGGVAGGDPDGDRAEDWAVLVLADGAVTHDVPGAGRVDRRSPAFDAAVGAALAAGGTAGAEALAALDSELAAALGARGRAAWQVLAGLALGTAAQWRGELLYDAAPYGVGYHVAYWERR